MNHKHRLESKFLVNLARNLHESGASTHEIEKDLIEVSRGFGVDGSFLITPTSISMTIDDGEDATTQSVRLFPAGINLDKLNRLKQVFEDVLFRKINLGPALLTIREIEYQGPLYKNWLQIISYSVVASCLVVFMRGSPADMLAAFLAGTLVGFLNTYLTYERVDAVKSTIIAFAATCFVFLSRFVMTDVHVNTTVISAIIILVPGLSFTIALSELANRHITAGTARFVGAIVEFFKLGAGIIVAHYLFELFNISAPAPPAYQFSLISIMLAVLLCSTGASIIFNCGRKEIPWVVMCCLLVFAIFETSRYVVTPNISIFCASLMAGLLSNGFSRKTRKTASTLLLPSVVFLVPGAIGLQGLNILLSSDASLATPIFIKTLVTGLLIVSGIFFADATLPARP